MPSEPLPWDRKEYFKARKEGMSEYVASEDSPKLPPTAAEDYGVLLNCLNMDSQLSHPSEKVLEDPNVLQFKKKFCSSSLFDENSNGNNPVFCSPKDLTLDVSANILAERWCNASDSDPFGTPCQEPTSVSDWKLDQNFSKDSPHRSCPGSNDYPVGLDYKPIRLMHTGRFSSYESGLSGSSSSKSNSVDFSNSRDELPKQSSCLSASGDTIACATPTTPSEEMSPWKRPRLRWGEGLAKFEKKFSGPDDGPSKSETISCISAQVSDCASPVTPSSAACSFFTGSVDKPLRKTALVSDENCIAHTLLSESQMHLESSTPFKLEILDLSIITHAVPSLIKMINSQCSEDFSSTSCSIMSKLLFLKSEILKTIDMTESHVESLENELKSFNNEPGQNDCRCEASDTEVTKTSGKAGEGNSEMSFNPALPLYAPAEVFVVKAPVDNGNGMKAGMDTPETVTSKQVEPSPFASPHPENGMINNVDHFFYLTANHLSQEVQKTARMASQAGKMNNVCVNVDVSSEIGCHMAVDERLIDSIWTSNRECANKTSVDFNIVFPVAETVQHCNSKFFFLRDLIVRRKRFLRFKEQAVALKWRALHSSWKDNMRLLSVRNHSLKAEKQWEIFLRVTLNNQPLFRSKSLHVKEPSLDMGKLLSISNTKKLCRSVLKMPALILDDDDDRRTSRFLSCNRLVDDPCAAEKERSMVNAWTSEERNIFMDNLASHGKDFRKIASFLDHKTTADCVEFYYKNHKSGSFMKTFKQKDKGKLVKSLFNNTYLVAPSKKCDRNMDTASLHILGAASELVARNSESKEEYKKRNFCGFLKHDVGRNVRKEGLFLNSPSNFRFAEKELGTAGNESGACDSVSSEAISSCITSSVNQGEGNCNGTPKTFSIISNHHSVLEDRQSDDEETCSDEISCELDVAYWTDREKSIFVRAVKSYGKDFSMVSRCITTKSKDQCKSFYSKARMCLGLEIIHPDNDHEQQSVINSSIGEDGTPTLISTPEAVTDTGNDEVSQRIDEDMSLSVSVMSSVDLLSPDAGFRFHALHYKLEGKEGKVEVPFDDLIVRRRSVDKSVSNHDKSEDSQAFLCEVSESANPSVRLSHSLPSIVPYFRSSAQAPLLQNHSGGNSTLSDCIPNNDSYFIEDPGTPWAPCQGPADSRPLIGYTAAIPLMNISKGSERDETSEDCTVYHASFGLSKSASLYAAALPTLEVPFVNKLFGGTQGHFQRPHWHGNHLLHQADESSDKFYASKNLRKRENNGSGWNLNFEDSTISRGSNSDSKNRLPPYASIPQRCYIQRCNSLNSNHASADLPNFTQSTSKHLSRNQAINPMDPAKQGKQSNLKLFGQVLIPSSNAPEPHHSPHSISKNKFTQIAQWCGTLFDVRPSDCHNRFLGHENIPVRSSWDDRLMQAAPLLDHCPVLLSNGMSTSSILDRQVIETTAVPNVNAPLNAAPISGNILNRSMMSHHSHTSIARHDL